MDIGLSNFTLQPTQEICFLTHSLKMRKVRFGKGKQLVQGHKLIDSNLVALTLQFVLSLHIKKGSQQFGEKRWSMKMSGLLPFSLFFHT